jgi:hypothetical protein
MEAKIDANIRATHYLVDHLRDPSSTVASCQSIEAPVSIRPNADECVC